MHSTCANLIEACVPLEGVSGDRTRNVENRCLQVYFQERFERSQQIVLLNGELDDTSDADKRLFAKK